MSISDTGPGIEEGTLHHLFEPYFQGNSQQSQQGLGLGLSIAKHIVKLSEGEIYVKSTVGQGSTFTVELPIC